MKKDKEEGWRRGRGGGKGGKEEGREERRGGGREGLQREKGEDV